jgi:hypothetical protein
VWVPLKWQSQSTEPPDTMDYWLFQADDLGNPMPDVKFKFESMNGDPSYGDAHRNTSGQQHDSTTVNGISTYGYLEPVNAV